MAKPRLLDLFCGAGGAAMGYSRAGFEVVGVDIKPQPNYPFDFVQADALEVLACLNDPDAQDHYEDWLPATKFIHPFDAIHASPPCQRWTIAQNARKQADQHPDLITPLRPLLEESGLPYVIENVPGAPLIEPTRLCMAQLLRCDGFELRRHRLFETSFPSYGFSCGCGELPAAPVFGHNPGRDFMRRYGRGFSADRKREIMETPWMNRNEVAEAIPPAFTEHIGRQLLDHLERVGAAA